MYLVWLSLTSIFDLSNPKMKIQHAKNWHWHEVSRTCGLAMKNRWRSAATLHRRFRISPLAASRWHSLKSWHQWHEHLTFTALDYLEPDQGLRLANICGSDVWTADNNNGHWLQRLYSSLAFNRPRCFRHCRKWRKHGGLVRDISDTQAPVCRASDAMMVAAAVAAGRRTPLRSHGSSAALTFHIMGHISPCMCVWVRTKARVEGVGGQRGKEKGRKRSEFLLLSSQFCW